MRLGRAEIILIAVVVVIMLTGVIFAIPFNTVPYNAIETYFDTEMKQEAYTASEPYTTSELGEMEETIFDDTRESVPNGIRVTFTVTKVGTKLIGMYELPAPGGFYVYGPTGMMVHEQRGMRGNIEVSLPEGRYEAMLREGLAWKGTMYLMIKLKWMELGEVTKYTEVTKYREVPVQVEKQRTVTKYKKVSLWQKIFGP